MILFFNKLKFDVEDMCILNTFNTETLQKTLLVIRTDYFIHKANMEPLISYENFTPSGNPSYIDLAAAVSSGIKEEIILDLSDPNAILFVPATPNELGQGDVASNFRSKISTEVNNDVVDSWFEVFRAYKRGSPKNPVVVTSVARSERRYTLQMLQHGNIVINDNNHRIVNEMYTEIFQSFLERFGITYSHMKIIREASKGAKYNSYMADMIGFVNMMNWHFNTDMFESIHTKMEPYIVKPSDVYYRHEVKGQKMLQPVKKGSRTWVPMEDCNYLYFRTPSSPNKHTSQEYFQLRKGNMEKVYSQIFYLLSDKDTGAKKMLRTLMLNIQYKRLSDFWFNDVDDGFTILMILNAYHGIEVTPEEVRIKERLEDLKNRWITELNTKFNSFEPEPEPEM